MQNCLELECRLLYMRSMLLLFVLGLASVSVPQDVEQKGAEQGLFGSVKPDATIVVKKHSTGADMVEVTMLNPAYPPELLKERIFAIGKELGVEARGVSVGTYSLGAANDPNLRFVKGTFAIDGLVDVPNHRLRIQSIVRAFVGDPEPLTVRGLSIFFSGLQPHPRYVRTFVDDHVRAEARVQRSPIAGIEYRIRIDATKPESVVFPEYAPERKALPPPSETENRSKVGLWIAILVAALAAGALVYLAVIRSGARTSSAKGKF